MTFWNSMEGMVAVQMTCADMESAFRLAVEKGIVIHSLEAVDALTYQFTVLRRDYGPLEQLCRKKGFHLQKLRQKGIYWTAARFVSHKVLLAGTILLLCFLFFLPTRVLFVEVQGNEKIPERRILAAAEECGIRFGASRGRVRSEKLKNQLLAAIPELKWAGINTNGCTAVISVREKTAEIEENRVDGEVCNIVASRDGVIDSCTITKGNQVCQVGQAVSKGELLISGYWDCGICIRASRAEGEVMGITVRSLDAVIPTDHTVKTQKTFVKRKYSILIGKKRINLFSGSGIWDTTCGRMYREYVLTLPGGFHLPVSVGVSIYSGYDTAPGILAENEARSLLEAFSVSYVLNNMIAGSVLQKDNVFTRDMGKFLLCSTFNCREMIGAVQWEQDGVYNGKDR